MNKTIKNIPPIIAIGLLFFVMASGIFLPIYGDEIVSKWSVARFFLDDQKLVSFFPQCSTMADRAVAWSFYPAAILISAIYSYLGPLGIRVSGIVLTIVWFSLIALWCLKQTNDKFAAIQRFSGLIALSSLGVMPYLLILSRAEQLMTLPILGLCLTALFFKGKKAIVQQYLGAGLCVVMLSCFFYVHPKSLFYLPFLLLAVWFTTEGYHKLLRVALLSYALILFAQVLHDSGAISTCTDAPAMQALLSTNTLLPQMIFSAPQDFANAAYTNLINFPDRLLIHITFNQAYQSGWLPPTNGDTNHLWNLNLAIKYFLYAFIVVVHATSLMAFIVKAILRQLSPAIALAALLASADITNVLFFNIQNFYSGTQYVPITLLLTALLLQSFHINMPFGRLRYFGLIVILTLSATSMLTLLTLTLPTMVKNSSLDTASVPGQIYSIPSLNVPAHLKSIETLGTSCKLPFEHAENMILDDMTYFAFLKNKKPVHISYVSENGFGGDLTNGRLLPFLKKIKSPGVITRCEWMPAEFRKAQKSNDMGYCCVNLEDL